MDRTQPRFRDAQQAHFLEANEAQFRWTTGAPGIAEVEDELLAPLLPLLASPCVEVGCGEGSNLRRLAGTASCIGVDRFVRKLHFARGELGRVRFAAADATRLPFRDASVRCVFVRDLLHHLPEPGAALREAVRILAPGGRLVLLEPNGRNPLIRLQTLLVPAEVGARESTAEAIRTLLEPLPLDALRIELRQPLALRRLALHYRMGLPVLGRFPPTAALLRGAERILGRLVPECRRTYIQATAVRRPSPPETASTPGAGGAVTASPATGSCP